MAETEIQAMDGVDANQRLRLMGKCGLGLLLSLVVLTAGCSPGTPAEDPEGAVAIPADGISSSEADGDPGDGPTTDDASTEVGDQTEGSVEPDSGVGDVEAASDEGEAVAEDSVGLNSGVDAVASRIELVTESNIMSTDMDDPAKNTAELMVDRAYSTQQALYRSNIGKLRRTGDVAAREGMKLAIVDVQMLVNSEIGTLNDAAIRLVDQASGMIYTPVAEFNSMTWMGTLFNEHIFFEVPADLMSFTVQGGALDGQRDGFQSAWEVDLEPGDVAEFLPDESPAVEGSAASELISESNAGTTNLSSPGDFASVDVLGAETLAKIEGEAPGLGFKWLVVDVQIVGQARFGRLSDEAIHVQADGEWYPNVYQINDEVRTGDVWTGRLLFEIPVAATEAVFKLGAPTHWRDGERAEYKLTLAG